MSKENKNASVFIIIVAIVGLILGGMVISAPVSDRGDSLSGVLEDESIISRNHKFILGNENAKVRVVVFSDFLCPYCANIHDQINQIIAKDPQKISAVTRSFIVHDEAFIMSKAAFAAGLQGKYSQASDLLFTKYTEGSEEKMIEMAQELSLDIEKFKSDLNSEETESSINADNEDALALNLKGTPSVFVNNKYVDDLNELEAIIEEESK